MKRKTRIMCKRIFSVALLAMIALLVMSMCFGVPALANAESADATIPIDLLGIAQQYAVLPVTVVCLGVGWILKNAFPNFNNNFIPLALFPVGIVGVLWINGFAWTPDTFFAGFCSAGLAVYIHSGGKHLLNFIHAKQEETKPPEQ